MITDANQLSAAGSALSDHELAGALATLAGEVLLDLQRRDAPRGAPALGSLGDATAQRVIAQVLTAARSADAVLSEEAADDARRLTAARVWIVDPLDGTREYAEGRPDWAVHIALWSKGRLAAGAVALPGLDTTLLADPPPVVPPRDPATGLRIAVSRTRPPAVARWLARQLDAELVPMGSAGFKVAAVIRGEVDLYVHAGGQYEWDSAAPVAVADAAGLHTSRIDGSELVYNRPDPLLPDLLVVRPELADRVLNAIGDHALTELTP